MTRRTQRKTSRQLRVALFLCISALLLSACGESRRFSGTMLPQPKQVSSQGLIDQTGKPFEIRAQPNHLLIMYIGFTYCPDVCPTTMTKIRDAREKLGTHASRIDVAMLTIDPQRDNMQALREYVTRFVENGTALRANSIQDLDAVVRSFGASYVNKPGPTPDKPEVWHSTWHYAIDSDGQLIAQWPLETKTSDFAADLAQLLKTKAK